LSGFVLAHRDSPLLSAFFKGVLCAVAALVAALVWTHLRRSLLRKGFRINILPYALVVALILWAGLHPLVAMACGVAFRFVLPEGKPWNF
jgi:chromate transporter